MAATDRMLRKIGFAARAICREDQVCADCDDTADRVLTAGRVFEDQERTLGRGTDTDAAQAVVTELERQSARIRGAADTVARAGVKEGISPHEIADLLDARVAELCTESGGVGQFSGKDGDG